LFEVCCQIIRPWRLMMEDEVGSAEFIEDGYLLLIPDLLNETT
jgi:hypothetical protein